MVVLEPDSYSINFLTEHILLKYGYDFSNYSKESFKRRITRIMFKYSINTVDELIQKLKNDNSFFHLFLEQITVNVTEMFRDAEFFKVLRRDIIPKLSSYPLIRIWHAGCSTGEEVYSMAILLKESGLLERSLLYATDINQAVLNKASCFTLPVSSLHNCEEAYLNAGGMHAFSDYYTINNGQVFFNDEFKKRMVFSVHNLVHDTSFNEFNIVLCRNVLIYFNRNLQEKVIRLFSDSVSPLGFLALGNKESIDFTSSVNDFEIINKQQRIWRKNINSDYL